MGNLDFTKRGYNVNVLFNFAGGIADNAPVRLLGVEVGKVEKVDLQYGEETKVILTLWLDESTELKTDSKAYVSALGLMGEKYIEINPGSKDAPLLEPGSTIIGEDPFQMEAFTKKGEELMAELSDALTNIKSLTKNVDGMVTENKDEVNEILKNVETTTANLKELSTDLKQNPWKIITKPRDWKKRM
jgi:phospholipid/cholesterol/gamma-HCH transport system substrate-binding protein